MPPEDRPPDEIILPPEDDALLNPSIDKYPAEWSGWVKRFTLVVLALGLLASFQLLSSIFWTLVLSTLLAFLLFIPSLLVTRRLSVSYGLAVAIVFGSYVLISLVIILSVLPQAVAATETIAEGVTEGVETITEFLLTYEPEQGLIPVAGFTIDVNPLIQPISDTLKGASEVAEGSGYTPNFNILFDGILTAANFLGQTVGAIGNFFVNSLFVHLIALLFLLEVPKNYGRLYDIKLPELRREYLLLLAKIYNVWIQFFRVQVVTGIIIGVLTWLQFVLMGIPQAGVIGLFTGLTSLIPNIGGLIALVPIALIPLFQGSNVLTDLDNFSVALLVVAVNFIMQQIFWNLIVPKMTSEALELSLPVVILGVFIGAAVGGILGAFLVVPIMGSGKVILIYVFRKLRGGDPYPGQEEPELFANELLADDKQDLVNRPA